MMKYLLPVAILVVFFFSACSDDSITPVKVDGHSKKAYEENAVDTVGVAKGNKKISPNGRPAY